MSASAVRPARPASPLVLSEVQWRALRDHVTPPRQELEQELEQEPRELQELERRRAVSARIRRDWPAQRPNLPGKKIQRCEDQTRQEKTDRPVSAEEVQLKAARRKEQLSAAREMLFQPRRRTRSLDRALLLSEVLEERRQQVALKCRLRTEERGRDRQVEAEGHWTLSAEREERRRRERRAAAQRDHAERIADSRRQREEAKRHEMGETERARRADLRYRREQELSKREELEKNKQWKEAALEQVRDKQALREQERAKEEEESAARRSFGLYRLTLADAVRRRRAESLRDAQRRSEAACDRLAALRAASQARDEAADRSRAAAAVAERRAQGDQREAERAAFRTAMESAVRRAWSADLRGREGRRRAAAEAVRHEARAAGRRRGALAEEQRRRQRQALREGEECRRQWRRQVAETEASRVTEKERAFNESQELQRAIRREQDQYEQNVRAEMSRLTVGNRNTFPLKAHARIPAPGFDFCSKLQRENVITSSAT